MVWQGECTKGAKPGWGLLGQKSGNSHYTTWEEGAWATLLRVIFYMGDYTWVGEPQPCTLSLSLFLIPTIM